MQELENKSYWSLEEFANYTGYSKNYAYKLISRNQIPYYKFIGKVMFARDDVFRLIQNGLVKSNDQLEQEIL